MWANAIYMKVGFNHMHAIKIKIQVTNGKEIAFGPGKAQLLEAIHQFGSISAAAKSMNMSYKRAWDLVAVMNTSFISPLVTTTVGGSQGGHTALTETGHQVLQVYNAAVNNADQFIQAELANFIPLLSEHKPD